MSENAKAGLIIVALPVVGFLGALPGTIVGASAGMPTLGLALGVAGALAADFFVIKTII